MAEAIIAFVDAVPNTDPNYPYAYLALDIIACCDDGWGWTLAELTNPDWRLLKMPTLLVSQVAPFMAPRVDANGGMVRLRDWCFDSTQVPSAVMTYIQNNQVITLTAAKVSNALTWMRKHSTTLTAS